MTTPNAFAIELTLPPPAAIEAWRAALGVEQMGIVSEVDMQATLKTKLGLDCHPLSRYLCGPEARVGFACRRQLEQVLNTMHTVTP